MFHCVGPEMTSSQRSSLAVRLEAVELNIPSIVEGPRFGYYKESFQGYYKGPCTGYYKGPFDGYYKGLLGFSMPSLSLQGAGSMVDLILVCRLLPGLGGSS